jgi:hypothetical protein
MNRYTYEVNEPESFKELLDFWSNQEHFYPIFVEWLDGGKRSCARFLLETDLYRAILTVTRDTPEEVMQAIDSDSQKNHELIECRVYENDGEA